MKRLEKETIINYNEVEQEANIYTHSISLMARLDKLCNDFPKKYRLIEKDEFSKTYMVSKKYIKIAKPRPELTEEQKAQAGERLKRYRAKI